MARFPKAFDDEAGDCGVVFYQQNSHGTEPEKGRKDFFF
jgi:hypothetical protein